MKIFLKNFLFQVVTSSRRISRNSITYSQDLVFQPRPAKQIPGDIVYTPTDSVILDFTSRRDHSTSGHLRRIRHLDTLGHNSSHVSFVGLLDELQKNFNKKSAFYRKLVRLKSICANAYVSVRNQVVLAKNDEESAFTSPYCE